MIPLTIGKKCAQNSANHLGSRRILHSGQPEAVTIPPEYAAEMAPYLAMVGEFRVHYAGFFDPGFGHASAVVRISAAFLKSAAMRRPLSWNTGKLWDVWSMRRCLRHPASFTVGTLPRTTKGKG